MLYCLCVCVAVRKSHAEVEAMKRQAKGLAQEYDRLLMEHHQLQVKHTHTHPQRWILYVHEITEHCVNHTNTGVILLHRISRVLQTKRISNHRNTVTCFQVLSLLFPWKDFLLIILQLCAMYSAPPEAMFVFTTFNCHLQLLFLWCFNRGTFI